MADSIRERILVQVEKNVDGLRVGFDGYSTNFKLTTREPLTRLKNITTPACSIIEGNSRVIDGVGFITHIMRLQFEVYATRPVSQKTSASAILNVILADLQKVLLTNINTVEEDTSTPLTIDVQLVGDEMDVDGPSSSTVSLLLEADVTFRHNKQDPFTLKPGGQ